MKCKQDNDIIQPLVPLWRHVAVRDPDRIAPVLRSVIECVSLGATKWLGSLQHYTVFFVCAFSSSFSFLVHLLFIFCLLCQFYLVILFTYFLETFLNFFVSSYCDKVILSCLCVSLFRPSPCNMQSLWALDEFLYAINIFCHALSIDMYHLTIKPEIKHFQMIQPEGILHLWQQHQHFCCMTIWIFLPSSVWVYIYTHTCNHTPMYVILVLSIQAEIKLMITKNGKCDVMKK